MRKHNYSLIIVSLILGFMLAIQFNSLNHKPEARDTRNQWELRETIMKEKETNSKLLNEIRMVEKKLAQYESDYETSKGQALMETLDDLKTEIGLSEVSGYGISLIIEPIFTESHRNLPTNLISPDLLQQLVNELNMFGAQHISIADQRIVNTTVIREINGDTKVDGLALRDYPLEIKVITESYEAAERLHNRMLASNSVEGFFIDNLKVSIKKPESNVTVPAYRGKVITRGMKPVEDDERGKE